MSRVFANLESTIKELDRKNTRTQRFVIVLAAVAIAVGVAQCVIALVK